MSSPDRTVHALVLALQACKRQNDKLRETNSTLIEQNEQIWAQNEEMKKYCASISAIADIVMQAKHETAETKEHLHEIGDSLIMLWGQLAAHGVVGELRQRVRAPPRPCNPVMGVPADIALEDLYCTE